MRTLTTALALAALLIAPAAMAQTAGGAHSAATPAQGTASGATSNSAAGTASAGGAGRYQSETAAKQACGTQTVVWVNTGGSKAWHVSGDKYFGHTKHGAYMCEQAARQAGYHPAGSIHGKQKTAKAAH